MGIKVFENKEDLKTLKAKDVKEGEVYGYKFLTKTGKSVIRYLEVVAIKSHDEIKIPAKVIPAKTWIQWKFAKTPQ